MEYRILVKYSLYYLLVIYRVFVISCIGIIVYCACYFGFYDTLKPIVLRENAGVILSFMLGYVVTISAGLVSYPIDTI